MSLERKRGKFFPLVNEGFVMLPTYSSCSNKFFPSCHVIAMVSSFLNFLYLENFGSDSRSEDWMRYHNSYSGAMLPSYVKILALIVMNFSIFHISWEGVISPKCTHIRLQKVHGIVWKDDLVAQCIDCSFKGPSFTSLHPHGSHQPIIIPVPGAPMPSTGFLEYCMHMVHIHAGKHSNT